MLKCVVTRLAVLRRRNATAIQAFIFSLHGAKSRNSPFLFNIIDIFNVNLSYLFYFA